MRVDEQAGLIAIDAEGWTSLNWIVNGETLDEDGPVLEVSRLRGVVRAVLEGPTGRTYIQPFFVDGPAPATVAR